MLLLFDTPAGYALFSVLDEGKLRKPDTLAKAFETVEGAQQIVRLQAFQKFKNTTEALAATTALVESKLSKGLKKFLQKKVVDKGLQENLAILDSKLGGAVKEKLGIQCVYDNSILNLCRGVREHLSSLLTGVSPNDLQAMVLGLSHSLARYKLKFSPDKIDTMVIQAIGLLDDLDKEMNTFSMRLKDWYGWHFPELAKIVVDNIMFARTVQAMGDRSNAVHMDLSGVLPEDLEAQVKEASIVSMGTEINAEDLLNIRSLCAEVLELADYRAQLYDYLQNRMEAIAPNLTMMVGELVGARLIAHAGSLLNLAKQPASTVQILGAEKALFRALKTRHETPKYGLIYHASIVGKATPKNKGKISRVLAAKTALSIRVDALGEREHASIAIDSREKVISRLQQVEGKVITGLSTPAGGSHSAQKKYDPSANTSQASYNPAADSTRASEKPLELVDGPGDDAPKGKKSKKVKKAVKRTAAEVEEAEESQGEKAQKKAPKTKKAKKVKKTSKKQVEEPTGGESSTPKKLKKKKKVVKKVKKST